MVAAIWTRPCTTVSSCLAHTSDSSWVSSDGSPVILPTTMTDPMVRCHDEQVNICVPITASGDVAPRWGRADRVAVAEVSDGIIRDWREFEVGWSTEHDASTEGAHHARIATFLLDNKIAAVAVEHVGPGMQRMLDTMNVAVFADRSGSAREAVIAGT